MPFDFHPEASEEVLAAITYFEDVETGLGLDFSREVHTAIQNADDVK